MHNAYRFLLFIFFIIHSLLCMANSNDRDRIEPNHYGLTFLSHSVNQDKRTGLNLNPEKEFSFSKDGFSIQFDVKLSSELHTYGYIFRIISKEQSSFDLISNLLLRRMNFILNDMNKIIENKSITDSVRIVADKWIHVKIDFTKQDIKLSIDDYKTSMAHTLDSFTNIKIMFGSNKHLNYYTTDVPPMTIRNISITEENKPVRLWKLSYHNQTEVLDEIKSDKATVSNGIWEIDKHSKWEKIKTFTFKNQNPQIAYDSIGGRIFIVLDKEVYSYNVEKNTTDTAYVKHGNPYKGASGVMRQIIYNHNTNNLISYTSESPQLNMYDFDKKEWALSPDRLTDTKQHHNHLIDKKRNRLILYVGYGHHMYDSEYAEIELNGHGTWETGELSPPILPRYLSALGIEDEQHVLLLGGHGSISGRQEESPRNFYDLYRINIENGSNEKLWEFENDKQHYTFGNSMIVDKSANKLYTLAYNNDRFHTSIFLYSFDIETTKPSPTIISDSIDYDFLDIKSYCDLFLDSKTSTMYAIILHEKNQGTQTVEIYSLAFPPLSTAYIKQKANEGKISISNILLICIAIILIIAAAIYIMRRKLLKKNKDSAVLNSPYTSLTSAMDIDNTDKKKITATRQSSAILLMGGFQIFDKNGENITRDFTPTLKLLFLFLLLHSIKNEKGTTSQQLDDTFWFDMDRNKAINNRGVNIRKLRLIADNIGGVDIINRNGYWFVNIDGDAICDYKEITALLTHIKKGAAYDKVSIAKLINLASGELLPNTNAEWLDNFKSEYSMTITEVLLTAINQPDIKKDSKLILKIADTILINDNIDEDAIKLKCRTLFQMGQKGLSKQSFDKFSLDYEKLLNTKPGFTYESIIFHGD